MRRLRAKRRDFGKPFRLDYVDKQGRTGSELAAEAGRLGGKARSLKHKQEKPNEQDTSQPSTSYSESVLPSSFHDDEPS
jgi:hypothetical protein